MKSILVSIIAAYLAVQASAPEAVVRNLEKLRSYDELFGTAHLVLLVEPLSVRDATEQDKVIPPDRLAKYLDSFVARLQVLHVIKGKYTEETIELVHFRWKKDAQIMDASTMIDFNRGQRSPKVRDILACNEGLLLFLSKTKDGRYEFLTGQLTPSQSVRQLSAPRGN